jgi:sarcosine oxidase gamma subunit
LQVFKGSVEKHLETKSEKDREKMSVAIKQDLIISVINHGYSDEFMASARNAGATGGTVISARGVAHKGPVKFFGISVQDEKEIILIVAARAKRTAIMQAVSQSHGVNTKAGGIVFSLPVDGIMGLDLG